MLASEAAEREEEETGARLYLRDDGRKDHGGVTSQRDITERARARVCVCVQVGHKETIWMLISKLCYSVTLMFCKHFTSLVLCSDT